MVSSDNAEMAREFATLYAAAFMTAGALLSWAFLGAWLENLGIGFGGWMLSVLPTVKYVVIGIGCVIAVCVAIAGSRGVFADDE